MANKAISYGCVTVSVSESLVPPEEAGSLSSLELARLPKAPRAIGTMCEAAAQGIEGAGKRFTAPIDLTPTRLREAGERTEGMDEIIHTLEVVLNRFKQANRIVDAEAYRQVRQVNDQVKAQAKHNPELATIFRPLLEAFAVPHSKPKSPNHDPNTPPAPLQP